MQLHIQNATIHLSPAGMLTLPVRGEGAEFVTGALAASPDIDRHRRAGDCPAQPGALTPPALGEYWPGQGGYFCGTMPARDGAPARHLVFSKDEAEDLKWGPYEDESGAASHHNGAANTAALVESKHDHPAAQWASKVTADGHTDFHLPAHAELMMAWICAPQLFKTEGWYWSSTQGDRHGAFVQHFASGGSGWGDKDSECRVRAVRTIQL
jgi:hypothetical protein